MTLPRPSTPGPIWPDASVRIVLAALVIHVLAWLAHHLTGERVSPLVLVPADLYAAVALLRAMVERS